MEKKKIENDLKQIIKNNDEITSEVIVKAEEVNFKDVPQEIIKCDNYGFVEALAPNK